MLLQCGAGFRILGTVNQKNTRFSEPLKAVRNPDSPGLAVSVLTKARTLHLVRIVFLDPITIWEVGAVLCAAIHACLDNADDRHGENPIWQLRSEIEPDGKFHQQSPFLRGNLLLCRTFIRPKDKP